MATLDPVKNFAIVTVSTGYDASATSIALTSGHGAKLPAPSTDGAFNLVWWNSTDYSDPSDDPNVEIVRVTGRSTDTLTVTRAQEGTSGSTKNTGGKTYKMILAVTKKFRDDVEAALPSSTTPVINVYAANAVIGSSTTRFDVTNPSGTTFRYTWDGTGTDPNINSGTFPIGSAIEFKVQNFSAGNNGRFIVTGVGSNYVEVTNASGVAEVDKTIGTGYVVKHYVWTKPAGLKYVIVELVGGGGGGGTGDDSSGGGGGGGGYSRKKINVATLGATEIVAPGPFGPGATSGTGTTGRTSYFGTHCSATGGNGGIENGGGGGAGGSGTGGDFNSYGQGGTGGDVWNNNGLGGMTGGAGGSSLLGGGASSITRTQGGSSASGYGGGGGGGASDKGQARQNGGNGGPGVVIVTEYY